MAAKNIAADWQRRRFIFRSKDRDTAAADKVGGRVHKAWVRCIDTDLPFSKIQVVLAVAYIQDLRMADNPTLTEPGPVFVDEVSDVTGIGTSRAVAYLGEAKRTGALSGSANAGYMLALVE
jgi:hypothetical protein